MAWLIGIYVNGLFNLFFEGEMGFCLLSRKTQVARRKWPVMRQTPKMKRKWALLTDNTHSSWRRDVLTRKMCWRGHGKEEAGARGKEDAGESAISSSKLRTEMSFYT